MDSPMGVLPLSWLLTVPSLVCTEENMIHLIKEAEGFCLHRGLLALLVKLLPEMSEVAEPFHMLKI